MVQRMKETTMPRIEGIYISSHIAFDHLCSTVHTGDRYQEERASAHFVDHKGSADRDNQAEEGVTNRELE